MKVNTEAWYMWFKLYQRDIKSDGAKFDFLHKIRMDMLLEERHEKFYLEYAKKHGLLYTIKNQSLTQHPTEETK